MTAGTEADDLMDYIIETLEADTTLQAFGLNGWFKDGAQTPDLWPYGLVGVMASVGINHPGPFRTGANALIQVQVVGKDGIFQSVLKPAYQRVYQVLFGLQGATSYVTLFGKLFQEVDISYLEPQPVGGEYIRHLGGGWRGLAA